MPKGYIIVDKTSGSITGFNGDSPIQPAMDKILADSILKGMIQEFPEFLTHIFETKEIEAKFVEGVDGTPTYDTERKHQEIKFLKRKEK